VWTGLGCGPIACCCVEGNESSGTIKRLRIPRVAQELLICFSRGYPLSADNMSDRTDRTTEEVATAVAALHFVAKKLSERTSLIMINCRCFIGRHLLAT
jgi:hypothetical protein